LPVPSKKWYKSIDDEFLERSRVALEEYLKVTFLFSPFFHNFQDRWVTVNDFVKGLFVSACSNRERVLWDTIAKGIESFLI